MIFVLPHVLLKMMIISFLQLFAMIPMKRNWRWINADEIIITVCYFRYVKDKIQVLHTVTELELCSWDMSHNRNLVAVGYKNGLLQVKPYFYYKYIPCIKNNSCDILRRLYRYLLFLWPCFIVKPIFESSVAKFLGFSIKKLWPESKQ